ncbi:ABC transporter ATP-binding protein [Amylibacter sp.]|nr:ABC transporter ATP-binding protein [Amylibacter sp.]
MGSVRLKAVEKWFGDVQVIKGIDLEIEDGEFVVFVGPSGCGKSTLLRMISGLEETSRGRIHLDGLDVTDRMPSERELSMVFQSYALYPHMNVQDNMGFGLKTAGASKAEIADKVGKVAEILELTSMLERRPKDLSGGQRQRVAIGRAIVREPKGFLFDEPLSNLDAALRVQMRFEISKLHKKLKTTMIYVTHDQVEAMTLADKIVVLKDGKIMQVGTPRELYENPANLFVAQFIGSPKMNIIDATAIKGKIKLGGKIAISSSEKFQSGELKLGVRPEDMTFTKLAMANISGEVELVEYLGSDNFVYVRTNAGDQVLVRSNGCDNFEVGQPVHLNFDTDQIHFFE